MVKRMVELKDNTRDYFMVLVNHSNSYAPICDIFLRIDGSCVNLKSVLSMMARVGQQNVLKPCELWVINHKNLDKTVEGEEAEKIIELLEKDPNVLVSEWKGDK